MGANADPSPAVVRPVGSVLIDALRVRLVRDRPPKLTSEGRSHCLVGPGDAGKSAILSAIELVLDPCPSPTISDYDYFRRRVEDGFQITAVIGDLADASRPCVRHHCKVGSNGTLRPLVTGISL